MTPTLFCARRTFTLLTTVILVVSTAFASAQSVTLTGTMGGKALLIVDGSAPKIVAVGDSYQGVKVLSTQGDSAVVQINGKRINVRVGDLPASVGSQAGSAARGEKIVLSASDGGHFIAQGSINGKATQFMVDTGATTVAMGASDATRLGLDYTSGKPVRMSTANGTTMGYALKLNSVRIGDVDVANVDAIVSPQAMPYVLLGNSFLTRFSMRKDNGQMTLERRY